MKYMLLLIGDESVWINSTDEEKRATFAMHEKLGEELAKKNAFLAGEELDHSSTATTVRNEGGKSLVTDGPYAEVAEHLGGFYLIEADDLDEALRYAKMLPGTVEVRPVVEH
ncbi:YciI family protein [Paradevosia shaoguanensis]|uniref:YciI family protein n=1 Tax=Paradevosia shaoguanensis TaxID=1335043 RepID=UPI003C746F27